MIEEGFAIAEFPTLALLDGTSQLCAKLSQRLAGSPLLLTKQSEAFRHRFIEIPESPRGNLLLDEFFQLGRQ